MCVNALHACIFVHHVHLWCLRRPEEAIGYPGIMDGCESPHGCGEPNTAPLQKQPVHPSTEPPLQPHFYRFHHNHRQKKER